MTREDVLGLSFKALRELEGFVREGLEAKRDEAETEYLDKARALAEEYGFKVAGLPGRPRKKRQPRPQRSNGVHAEQPAG